MSNKEKYNNLFYRNYPYQKGPYCLESKQKARRIFFNINVTAIISTKNCCRHREYDFMKDLKDIGKGANPKFFNNKFLSQSMCLVFSELSNLKRSGNHLKESYFGHFLEF